MFGNVPRIRTTMSRFESQLLPVLGWVTRSVLTDATAPLSTAPSPAFSSSAATSRLATAISRSVSEVRCEEDDDSSLLQPLVAPTSAMLMANVAKCTVVGRASIPQRCTRLVRICLDPCVPHAEMRMGDTMPSVRTNVGQRNAPLARLTS